MRSMAKFFFAASLIIALALGMLLTSDEPANAVGNECPTNYCGSLDNHTYLGGCYNAPHECLGYKYQNNATGELCFISALN